MVKWQANGCGDHPPSESRAHPIIAWCAPFLKSADQEGPQAGPAVMGIPAMPFAGGGFSGVGCSGPRRVVVSGEIRVVELVGRGWIISGRWTEICQLSVIKTKWRYADAGINKVNIPSKSFIHTPDDMV